MFGVWEEEKLGKSGMGCFRQKSNKTWRNDREIESVEDWDIKEGSKGGRVDKGIKFFSLV